MIAVAITFPNIELALSAQTKENAAKTKSLYLSKVILSTALTLISYFALTKARQKETKKRVENEIAKEKNK
jgi:hypothetical protein